MSVCTIALMRHGGSHLIRPIIAQMGFETIIEPGKKTIPLDYSQGPVVVWLRDPRNRMIATLRWWKNRPGKQERLNKIGISDDEQLAWLLKDADGGFLDEMLRWARIWCGKSKKRGRLITRFEDMVLNGPQEINRISDWLELKCNSEEIFSSVFEKSQTFTGNYSDWKMGEIFGPKSEKVWHENGKGKELLSLMGYE